MRGHEGHTTGAQRREHGVRIAVLLQMFEQRGVCFPAMAQGSLLQEGIGAGIAQQRHQRAVRGPEVMRPTRCARPPYGGRRG